MCKCDCCKKKDELEVPETWWTSYGGLGFRDKEERDKFYNWAFEITDIVNKLNKKKN